MPNLVNKIMPITKIDIEQVRGAYGKSEEQIIQDVDIIINWMKQQPHLPKEYDVSRIERFLLRNKFRIERTKEKIENYYTLRGLYQNYFKNIDPLSEEMKNTDIIKFRTFIVLPKLTPKLERISLCYLTGNEHVFNMEHCVIYALGILDLEISHDYAIGKRTIFDLAGTSVEHLKWFDINNILIVEKVHQDAFCGRLTGIEILNAPAVFHTLFNLVKPVVKQKLVSKIRLHKNIESLLEVVPKECLPVEYGGDSFSAKEIHETTGKMLLEERQFLIHRSKTVSDENLRVGEVVQNQLFGVEGTFRKINLD